MMTDLNNFIKEYNIIDEFNSQATFKGSAVERSMKQVGVSYTDSISWANSIIVCCSGNGTGGPWMSGSNLTVEVDAYGDGVPSPNVILILEYPEHMKLVSYFRHLGWKTQRTKKVASQFGIMVNLTPGEGSDTLMTNQEQLDKGL